MEARTPFWMVFTASLGLAIAHFFLTGAWVPLLVWGLSCVAITCVQENKA